MLKPRTTPIKINPSAIIPPWNISLTSTVIAIIMVMSYSSYRHSLAIPPSTMALPDWAYAERQRLSPISVRGEVTEVSCQGMQCTLKMKVSQVYRNLAQQNIEPGNLLLINFLGDPPQEPQSINSSPPPIGAPITSVRIPTIGEQIEAWLRPAEGTINTYDLTSGPYGFGPNLEGIE